MLKFPDGMLKNRRLEHTNRSTSTNFIAAKVQNYLFSIFDGFPDDLFQEDKNTTTNLGEQAKTEILQGAARFHARQRFLHCNLRTSGLLHRRRNSLLQVKRILHRSPGVAKTDHRPHRRCPSQEWLYPFAGLQTKGSDIDPVNQLVVYALAFASSTRLPVKVLKCAWFDEKDYFEFFPLQAVRAKTAGASA
jgi:hypothetical protein